MFDTHVFKIDIRPVWHPLFQLHMEVVPTVLELLLRLLNPAHFFDLDKEFQKSESIREAEVSLSNFPR